QSAPPARTARPADTRSSVAWAMPTTRQRAVYRRTRRRARSPTRFRRRTVLAVRVSIASRAPLGKRIALAIAWSAYLSGCGPAARPPSILLITVDTLRADHLALYGYSRATSPNLEHWFAHGWVFDRAYATEASTTPSVISIL